MKKKVLIGLWFCIAVLAFIIYGVILVINANSSASNKEELCREINNMLDIIIKGNNLEANMNFIDNYKNKEINKTYMNLSNEELLEKGYIEYIQSTDYMVEFYSKIVINEVKLLKEDENRFEFVINVKRPNLLNVMNECDNENAENANYDFNKEFINKMKTNDFEYEEGEYNIIVHNIDNNLKFEYTEEFKNMLYSENNI